MVVLLAAISAYEYFLGITVAALATYVAHLHAENRRDQRDTLKALTEALSANATVGARIVAALDDVERLIEGRRPRSTPDPDTGGPT